MAHTEDCSTVLEQFIHDVANLPAEITHLMEEIQAKDKIMQDCRATINSRDMSLQKFIRQNGSHAPNPKEDSYSRTILQNLDRSQVLQDEKILLSEKACVLLDRQIKKLDLKIRELQNDGVLSKDPPIPSLFRNKDQYCEPQKPLFPESASAETPYASPLNPTSGNSTGQYGQSQRLNSVAGRSSSSAGLAASQTIARNSAPATPASAALHLQHRHRESSAGAADNKRRRLNSSVGTLPAASSNLRQSSLGPGTPKPGTPGASRAGSAGPRTTTAVKKPPSKKVAPHQQQARRKSSAIGKSTKRSSSGNGRLKSLPGNVAVSAATSRKKSPSSVTGLAEEEEDESVLSSAEVSEAENNPPLSKRSGGGARAADGESEEEGEEEEEDEGGEDTKTYCTCRSVSHGDMVACDNDDCPYEWFHWKCVGLTREPLGTWYCEECRKNLGK
ncbi:p21ING1c variant 2 [Histoplasma capsulatum var. duboisii H88]|uniref:Chromatin modification-related protein n=1 Tax=Ajellomyces capsulatus (strain H88) TaxID=544711 RepID=F0UKC2_AJEC8|nr:p21ING1c variant 2 [Histoplasma capsulatum var. duboisii H88]QSS56538.1 p21ING1c variant 2 [Histoplasma capsulatum var. duboisii H88]